MTAHQTIDDIFLPSILTEKIKLSPKHLTKDYKQKILEVLQYRNEDKCSKHGYIKKGSIDILKVSAGQLESHTLHGFVRFMVNFKALVCNPTNGSVVKSRVVNTNNFGVHCVCEHISQSGQRELIIDIIVPKKSISIQSNQSINLDSLQKDDIVFIEIIGKKYEINDKRIQAVGKIVSNDIDSTDANIDVENNEDNTEMPQFEDTYEEEFDEDIQEKDIISESTTMNNTRTLMNEDDPDDNEQNEEGDEGDEDDDEEDETGQRTTKKRLNVLAMNRAQPELDNSDNDEDNEDDNEDDVSDNDEDDDNDD